MQHLSLSQRCPILLLKGECPGEISANLPQHTGLEVSSNPEDLYTFIQVCLISSQSLQDSDPSGVRLGTTALIYLTQWLPVSPSWPSHIQPELHPALLA